MLKAWVAANWRTLRHGRSQPALQGGEVDQPKTVQHGADPIGQPVEGATEIQGRVDVARLQALVQPGSFLGQQQSSPASAAK